MPQVKIGPTVFDVPQPYGMSSFMAQQRVAPVALRILEILSTFYNPSIVPPREDGTIDFGDADLGKLLGVVAPQAARAFESLPPGELGAVTRLILAESKVVGIPEAPQGIRLFNSTPLGGAGSDYFDEVMRGRTIDTWNLLWKAIQIWYPDFLALAERLRAQKASAASLSEESA